MSKLCEPLLSVSGVTPLYSNNRNWTFHASILFYFIFLFPLSCPALWQQNCNLNTILCQTHLLCQGKVYEWKAPLVSQVLIIYLFLLQYFTCNSAEPAGGQGKRQPAATPAETKQKTSHGFCGESRWRTTKSACKQTAHRPCQVPATQTRVECWTPCPCKYWSVLLIGF